MLSATDRGVLQNCFPCLLYQMKGAKSPTADAMSASAPALTRCPWRMRASEPRGSRLPTVVAGGAAHGTHREPVAGVPATLLHDVLHAADVHDRVGVRQPLHAGRRGHLRWQLCRGAGHCGAETQESQSALASRAAWSQGTEPRRRAYTKEVRLQEAQWRSATMMSNITAAQMHWTNKPSRDRSPRAGSCLTTADQMTRPQAAVWTLSRKTEVL